MTAAIYDILCEQGATWEPVWTFREPTVDGVPGNPINLTGYSARMQVRESMNAASTLLSLTSGSGITLGGAAGTIAFSVSASTTAALPKGTFVYDFELVSGAGKVKRLLKGDFTVDPEVTR